MRLLVALLIISGSAQACSIGYQEFEVGAVDGKEVLASLGQDVVHIDLATGEQTTLVEQYFPATGFAGIAIVGYQEGLGADCSGTKYVAAYMGDTMLHRETGAETFDIDANRVAMVIDDEVRVVTAATWQEVIRFQFPRGSAEGPFGSSGYPPAIASDGNLLAVSDAEANILVYDDGVLLHRIDALADRPIIMDWYQGELVVGVSHGEKTDYWVFEDLATGEARTISLGDTWGMPKIAGGGKLWLQHGDIVVQADDDPKQLVLPAGLGIGTIAADGDLTLFLADIQDAQGIYQFGDDTWYAADDWQSQTPPTFSWTNGPAWVMSDAESEQPAPRLEESPGPSFIIVALGALLLARRYR